MSADIELGFGNYIGVGHARQVVVLRVVCDRVSEVLLRVDQVHALVAELLSAASAAHDMQAQHLQARLDASVSREEALEAKADG